jgi:hypothetical protein
MLQMRGVKHIHAPAAQVELVVQPAVEMVQPEIRIESADRVERLDAQQRRRVECACFTRRHSAERCRHRRRPAQPDIGRREQTLPLRQVRHDCGNARVFFCRAQPRLYGGKKIRWKRRVLIERQQPVAAFCRPGSALATGGKARALVRSVQAAIHRCCVVSEALRQLLRYNVTRRAVVVDQYGTVDGSILTQSLCQRCHGHGCRRALLVQNDDRENP